MFCIHVHRAPGIEYIQNVTLCRFYVYKYISKKSVEHDARFDCMFSICIYVSGAKQTIYQYMCVRISRLIHTFFVSSVENRHTHAHNPNIPPIRKIDASKYITLFNKSRTPQPEFNALLPSSNTDSIF